MASNSVSREPAVAVKVKMRKAIVFPSGAATRCSSTA